MHQENKNWTNILGSINIQMDLQDTHDLFGVVHNLLISR